MTQGTLFKTKDRNPEVQRAKRQVIINQLLRNGRRLLEGRQTKAKFLERQHRIEKRMRKLGLA